MTWSRSLLLAVLLVCLSFSTRAAAPNTAQQPSSLPAGTVDANPRDTVTSPVPQGNHNVENFYPNDAKVLGQEGDVTLNFTIHTDGSVADVTVRTSSGIASLDAAAVAAVSTWRYFPATRNGKSIETRYAAKVEFRISDNGGQAPISTYNVVEAPASAYPPEAIVNKQQGSTGVGILLDESGKVVQARVLVSSGVASLDVAAIKLVVQHWRFTAATLDGKPERCNLLLVVNWTLPASRVH